MYRAVGSDNAAENAKEFTTLPLYEAMIDPIGDFAGKLTIHAFTRGNKVVFDIDPSDDMISSENITLLKAEYDDEGVLTDARVGINAALENGHIEITEGMPNMAAHSYKYMLWYNFREPVTAAITNIE